jgi:hypothetical protein
MPFIKNISLKRRKTPSIPPFVAELTASVSAFATGSAGYFTSSNGRIYTGAGAVNPIYITYNSSIQGGTAPYTIVWTSSMNNYPTGYTQGTNTSSFTATTYGGNTDTWTMTVLDSSSPKKTVTASIDTIVYGDLSIYPTIYVDPSGNDTQEIQFFGYPGSFTYPMKTMNAAMLYAVPNETTMSVISGTYSENVYVYKDIEINCHSFNQLAGLGEQNYFIYDSKNLQSTGLRNSRIKNFNSSSFSVIGVSPSGSIQTAIQDISGYTGTVYVLGGVHEVNTSISMSYNNTSLTIRGVHVPTGSSDSYFYSPNSIIRSSNLTGSIFVGTSGQDTGGSATTMSNLALEIPTGWTSSYFTVLGARNTYLEMVRFRIISSSQSNEVLTFEDVRSTVNTQFCNTIDERVRPAFRNYYGQLVRDGTDAGFGTGKIYPGNYSPFQQGLGGQPNPLKYGYEALFSQTLTQNADVSSIWIRSVDIAGGNFSDRRPNLAYSSTESIFNGAPYLYWNASTTDREYLEANYVPSTGEETSSFYFNMVFRIRSVGTTDRVIHKWAGNANGFSIVTVPRSPTSDGIVTMSINLYTNLDGTQQHACMTSSANINTDYMVEMFFDPSSANKRVGMALYGTSSLISSFYFSSSSFNSKKIGSQESVAVGSMISFGTRTGNVRYRRNFDSGDAQAIQVLTSTGRSLWADTSIASAFAFFRDNPHKNSFANQVYNWARWKFFPTSSIVTRSISSDLD